MRHVMLSSYSLRARADHNSSRQAIQKYIKANNKVDNLSDTAYKGHVNRAIAHGVEKGIFLQPKGKCCARSEQPQTRRIDALAST
jgi:histone H1/5